MLPAVSLLVLVAVILIAWKFKLNPGLLGFGAAFVLGFFVLGGKANVPLSSIKGGCQVLFAGFNYKLWLRIMLVAIFFAIGQLDGTLEILTKKFIGLIRGRTKLLPIIFYLLTLGISAIGAGSIGVLILLMPIASAIIKEQKIDFLLSGLAVAYGAQVGGVSPMAATGIVGVSVAAEHGMNIGAGIFTHYLVCGSITMAVMYIVLGGWKYPNTTVEKGEKLSFNATQLKTLLMIVVFAALAIMGYEIAFVATACIAVLSLINDVDQKKIIAMAPWSTLVLLGGMGVLVKVVATAGGISMMTDFFKQYMNGRMAGVCISIVAAIMSFVSSASGVVMPTLIPTVPALAAATGATELGLINAITFGAHQSALSPFSTGGSLVLSMSGENIDQQKTFNKLIGVAFGLTVLGCVYCFFGMLG